ncbi:MAG TPA: protein kinase, partial [Thermoanaerobaculia bacterium]
ASPRSPEMMRWTATGRIAGTPLYLPPEALAGAEPAPGNDLWGLHLALWEVLAGRHPCSGMGMGAALRRIAAGDLPDVRSVRPNCPASIAEALRRGLHPDPRRRPPSAQAARDALTAAAVALA